jgi:hypothetical protein
MDNARFLVSENFGLRQHHSNLGAVGWNLRIFSNSGNKILVLSILINFVFYLTHNVFDFVAEPVQQIN